MKRFLIIFLLTCPAIAQIRIELPCPTSTDVLPFGQTVNNLTGAYRQWACVDFSGNVNLQGTNVAASTNGSYFLSTACQGATNCTQIFGDTKAIFDGSTTSSTVITCPSNDCNFTSADVGKTFWANSGPASSTATNIVCPVTTITSINGSQSANIGIACLSTGASQVFYWGHRDGATLHALDATIGCVTIQAFSGAIIMIDQAIFITPPPCSTSGLTIATNVPSRQWVPASSTVTFVMTPDFNYATCTGNGGAFTGNNVCIGTGLSWFLNTLIWGAGILASDSHANCAAASGKTILAMNPLGGFLDNVDLAGICPGESGNGVVLNSFDESFREGGAQNVMQNACVFSSRSTNSYNLDCINDAIPNIGLWVTNSAQANDFGTFSYDNVLIDGSSTLRSHGTTFRSPGAGFFAITTNGTHYSDGDFFQCNVAAEACVQVSASGVTTGFFSSHNSVFQGIGAGSAFSIVMGGGSSGTSTFLDLGGNTTTGGFLGCGSIASNTCYISGAQVLSAGCQGVVTASSTLGLYPLGETSTLNCTSTTVNLGAIMTRTGTVQGLNVHNTIAGVNASSGVVTLLKNGVATSITCTIGTTANGCRDGIHAVAYGLGDVLSFQVTSQAADTLSGISATVIAW